MKQRKVSEITSGMSKTKDVVGITLNVIVHGVHFAFGDQRCPLGCQHGLWLEGRKEEDRKVGR
jgi:hypothetical protein